MKQELLNTRRSHKWMTLSRNAPKTSNLTSDSRQPRDFNVQALTLHPWDSVRSTLLGGPWHPWKRVTLLIWSSFLNLSGNLPSQPPDAQIASINKNYKKDQAERYECETLRVS
eukprot:5119980-Amphidinium_carterae.1